LSSSHRLSSAALRLTRFTPWRWRRERSRFAARRVEQGGKVRNLDDDPAALARQSAEPREWQAARVEHGAQGGFANAETLAGFRDGNGKGFGFESSRHWIKPQ
jgi:hypothetical protein